MTDAHADFVQPLTSSTGIFFDGLGKLRIINGNLNVISYVNISYIGPHLTNLKEVIDSIESNCKQTHYYQCIEILSPLMARYEDIKRDYESMSHLLSKRGRRSAWFAGIGSVFKQIFGTLDEYDAIRYDSAIDSIQDDEKNIARLVKQNILITNTTLESFGKIISKLDNNQQILNNGLKQLLNITNNLTKISNSFIIESKSLSILTNLDSSLMTLSFQLEDLISAIILTKQNILHPSILTPVQLYQELVNNERHLPRSTRIPFLVSLNNIHLISSVSDVACYYYNNKLVFVLQIPLVTNDDFNLYHNLALPTPHGKNNPNVYSLIQPSSVYTAISYDKISYCNLDSLSNCKTVNSEFFLCRIPTIMLSSGSPTCVSELLTKSASAIPTQCKTKTIHGELDIWQPLTNNRWIYVRSQPNKIYIECGGSEIREVLVSGVGILHTPEKCIVYTGSVKLISQDDPLNISIPTPRLDFNIINASCCKLDPKSNNVTDIVPPILQNINLDNLKLNRDNDDILSQLSNIIERQPVLVKYGTHYFITNTFVILCLIIVLCYIIFKYRSVFSKSTKSVNPTSTDDDDALCEIEAQNESRIPEPRLRESVF